MHRTNLLNLLMCGLLLAACGEDDGSDGGVRDGAMDGMDASTPPADGSAIPLDGGTVTPDGSAVTPDGSIVVPDGGPRAPVPCQGHIYACGNGIDDDGDGLIDDEDPDCLGPCDNNEAGFYLHIPGGDSAPCQLDCYFDQDQGIGGGDCRWDHRCDPKEPSAESPPSGCFCTPPNDAGMCAGGGTPINGCCAPPSATCPDTQPTTCGDRCGPLVPNGCDCFGCCELPAGPGGALEYVFIGSVDADGTPTCSLDTLEGCHACTPVPNCLNDCGECEICLGRGFDELPAHCFPDPEDGGTPDTDGGTPPGPDVCADPERQSCGAPGLPPCPNGFFCLTGCCTVFG